MKQTTVALPMPPIVSEEAARSAPMPWRQILAVVWLTGVVSTVLIGLGSYGHTLRRYKRSRQPLSEGLQREIAGMVREVGLRRVPRVWMSAAVPSPAVTGLLRPVLLLPAQFEQTLTVHEARLVLKHELMHIKRGDLLVNALLCLLLSMHWFNPLMWFAFLKARFDREAACDAQVLGGEGQVERVAYGHTLLKVETSFSHHGLSLGFVGIFQRGAALRSRIRFIAARPNQHPLMKATLSLGIVLLSFLGITQAATPAPDPKALQIYITSKFVEITEQKAGASASALPFGLLEEKGTPGLIGTLTDPQFQVVIRELSKRKGVDLMAAPSVLTRSGQPARIEVVREFVYPDNKSRQVTENVGVFLELTPKVTREEQITLALAPKVVEFEGFAPAEGASPDSVSVRKVLHPDGTSTLSASDAVRGEVEESTYDAKGALISMTRVPYKKPVFSKREAKADVVLSDGQTVVMELQPRTDKQLVEETDAAGRTIKSETISFQRRCFVFVTANLIDPAADKK